MPELPSSGTWSMEELQLLLELTTYWTIGSIITPSRSQKIIEWTSAVADMNQKSKFYFISNRKYTIRECCDQYLSNWGNNFLGPRTLRSRWTTEEKKLMKEAIVTCPQRRCLVSQFHKLVPDLEGIKLFMNREGFQRGIRRRYYTMKVVELAVRTWGSWTVQVEIEKAEKAVPQTTNACGTISSDEGNSSGGGAVQEADQPQLDVASSQVKPIMYGQTIDLATRPG